MARLLAPNTLCRTVTCCWCVRQEAADEPEAPSPTTSDEGAEQDLMQQKRGVTPSQGAGRRGTASQAVGSQRAGRRGAGSQMLGTADMMPTEEQLPGLQRQRAAPKCAPPELLYILYYYGQYILLMRFSQAVV